MTTPPADPARVFRDTIGRFPTGVAIVTSIGSDGPAGMTTNAVTSLSLNPLLIIVCFEARSRTLDVVRSTRRFGVNVLRADDEALATVFASKRVGPEKFQTLTDRRWHEQHGVPVLDRAIAWVACELQELLPGGDHEIGIGAVVGTGTGADGDPLVFHRGRYTTTAGG